MTKIGASIYPWHRSTQCGIKGFTRLFAIFVPEPRMGYELEAALHRHFSPKRELKRIGKRTAREWYLLSPEDIEQIKRITIYRRDGGRLADWHTE